MAGKTCLPFFFFFAALLPKGKTPAPHPIITLTLSCQLTCFIMMKHVQYTMLIDIRLRYASVLTISTWLLQDHVALLLHIACERTENNFLLKPVKNYFHLIPY